MARTRRAKPRSARSRRADPRHPRRGAPAGGDAARRRADAPEAAPTIPRIALVDWLRGAALIGMTVFHFAYDLEFFGFEERGYADQAHWRYFATLVAGSFLFLAGVSLQLAHARARPLEPLGPAPRHHRARRRRDHGRNPLRNPEHAWIFFGILHMIAFGSIAGLAFLRSPWWCTAAAGVAVLAIDRLAAGALPDALAWYWIGLSSLTPVTSDFRPVFPWLAAVLFGIAAARASAEASWLPALARPKLEGRVGRVLRFLGRNSLVYYLLHQPVLFALFWTWLQLAEPVAHPPFFTPKDHGQPAAGGDEQSVQPGRARSHPGVGRIDTMNGGHEHGPRIRFLDPTPENFGCCVRLAKPGTQDAPLAPASGSH